MLHFQSRGHFKFCGGLELKDWINSTLGQEGCINLYVVMHPETPMHVLRPASDSAVTPCLHACACMHTAKQGSRPHPCTRVLAPACQV